MTSNFTFSHVYFQQFEFSFQTLHFLKIFQIYILFIRISLPVLRSEQQVRGVRRLPARHDRQRLGLEERRQGRIKQGLYKGQGHFLRRERKLLCHGGKQVRKH